ncbi:SMEK domain-containing protein [Salmonella enterica]|nr:SMEK domain-containing protein [Salmonella enterica]EKL9635549.1 SMEK domain-containing protein [Salmonella enterica]
MMKNEVLLKKLTDLLSTHAYTMKNLTAIGLNDGAVLSEDLYLKIGNNLFGISLTNTNIDKINQDTIDLYDEKESIAIQVTVRTDKVKIQSTIDNFIKKNHYLKYNKLYFLIIDNGRKEDYYKGTFNTENKFDFNIKNNIFLIRDIIAKARGLDINSLDTLVSNVSEYIDFPSTKKSERTELWNRISTLSNHVNYALEPDPTGLRVYDPDQELENSLKAISELLLFLRINRIHLDTDIINSVNEIIANASDTIDFTRIYTKRRNLGSDISLQDWINATNKKDIFNKTVSKIEGLLRQNT